MGVDPKARYAGSVDTQLWNRYAYARGGPFKFIDPDGRDIRIAEGGNAKILTKLLVQTAMRPTGRATLEKLASNRNFTVSFGTGSIPGNREAARTVRLGGSAKMTFGLTTSTVVVQGGAVNRVGADVKLDTTAIRGFHADRTGVQTFNHEIYHAKDLADGKTFEQVRAGDMPTNETGPAADYGKQVAEELPDLSPEAARAIVRSWLENRTNPHY